MNKKHLSAVLIGICIGAVVLGLFGKVFKRSNPKEYITACFADTAVSVYRDYSDAFKRIGVTPPPKSYTIRSNSNSYSTAPSDGDTTDRKGSPTPSIGELYGNIRVSRNGRERIYSGNEEIDCTVYTVEINRDILDKFIGELKLTDGYSHLRSTVADAIREVAANLGIAVSDDDIENVLNLVTHEKSSLVGCLRDDFSADVYVSHKKVYKITSELAFSDAHLEKVVFDATLGDGHRMLNRADLHLGVTADGKTMYFDVTADGNFPDSSEPLELNIKSKVTFDHLSIFDLSLSLGETDVPDNISAVGYYAISGKRTAVDGDCIISVGDGVTFSYCNSHGDNTIQIFAK